MKQVTLQEYIESRAKEWNSDGSTDFAYGYCLELLDTLMKQYPEAKEHVSKILNLHDQELKL